jgi:hypothetical protein
MFVKDILYDHALVQSEDSIKIKITKGVNYIFAHLVIYEMNASND